MIKKKPAASPSSRSSARAQNKKTTTSVKLAATSAKPLRKPVAKLAPKPAAKPPRKPVAKLTPKAKAKAAPKPTRKPVAKLTPKAAAKPAAKPPAKVAPKAVAKPAPKPAAKPAPRAAAKPAATAPASLSEIRRRDATGHLEKHYAADLRARSRENRDTSTQDAFLRKNRSADDLAEELGEEAVGAMTSGEYDAEDSLNRSVSEERGGPFVVTTAGQEFAEGTDASNPRSATREPFPKTSR